MQVVHLTGRAYIFVNNSPLVASEGNKERASEVNPVAYDTLFVTPHAMISGIYSEPSATWTGNFKWVLSVASN